MKQRVGILVGPFDPVHWRCLRTGLRTLNEEDLDLLLVLPASGPSCVAAPGDRWKMAVTFCACDEKLIPSRLLLDRGENTLTGGALKKIRRDFPDAKLITVAADLFPGPPPEEPALYDSGPAPDHLDIPIREYCRCKGLYGLPGRLEHIGPWIERLFADLKPRRFAHSLSVAYTAVYYARLHGLDVLKAEQAGLLHDCAKCLSPKEMRRIAAEHSLTEDESILSNPGLLHSIVGARVAEDLYGMTDPEVLSAIRYHNTGFAGMSRLDMCICLSDSIEPLRRSYPLLEEVRVLAEQSLERALLRSLESTADYVTSHSWYLHPRTRETIDWLKSLPENAG